MYISFKKFNYNILSKIINIEVIFFFCLYGSKVNFLNFLNLIIYDD